MRNIAWVVICLDGYRLKDVAVLDGGGCGEVVEMRSERRLCEEVKVNLAYRWFCGLGLEDKVSHHSTFSVNRHGRFRESDMLKGLSLEHALIDIRCCPSMATAPDLGFGSK